MRLIHHKLSAFATSIAFLSLFACSNHTFTDAEIKTIGEGEGIMKVCEVGDADDMQILRLNSMPLTVSDVHTATFRILKDRMLATVRNPANQGVGIAAPQVGISRRLIAVQRFDQEGEPFEFYVNPVIVEYSADKVAGKEGCLSVPDFYGEVERSSSIVLRYADMATLKNIEETVTGFTAIIFQHEIDHLNGIIFTDRMQN